VTHPATTAAPARSPWRTPALATAAVFLLNGTVIAAWVSRLPATRDRLDADPRTIGLVILMLGLGSLTVMPFVGRLVARFTSRPIVIAASVGSVVMLVVASLTPGAVLTGAALLLLGACYGAWDVAMNVQGSFVDRQAGRDYMPRYHACWSLGGLIGAGLGALAAAAGMALTLHFTIAAVVAGVGTVLITRRWYLDDREQSEAPAQPDDVVATGSAAPDADDVAVAAARTRLLSTRLVLIGIVTLGTVLLEGAAADWIALYLTDERGTTESVAALGYATFALAMAAARFSGTAVIDRLGRSRAVLISGVLATAGVITTLAVPGVGGALVGILMWGLGVALVFPAAMSAGGETPGRAADGIAAVATIGYGGFLLGPPLIGLLANEIGLGTALWLLTAMGVAIAVLSPAVAPRRTTAPAESSAQQNRS
jgi:predicted MFS family arabinose efflux permease